MIEVHESVQGLLFDCDGTLVDSMPMHMKAWEHAITAYNGVWDYDLFYSHSGMVGKDILALYNKKYNLALDGETVLDVKHNYFKKYIGETKPIQIVVDIVERYQNKLPMAVVSGGSLENVHGQLKAIGIFDRFQTILTADDDIKPKPAPDIFLAAAARLGVEPKRCHVFEDGASGLLAAERAGIPATDVRVYLPPLQK